MADADPGLGLSSDVQRALQLAVGEANHPFVHKTSRKKRPSDDDAHENEKRKRRGKRSATRGGGGTDAARSSVWPQALHDEPKTQSAPTEPSSPLPSPVEQGLSQDDHPASASSAAFLQAVVAAASATCEAHALDVPYHAQPQYQTPHAVLPASYLPYPPVNYGFPPQVPPPFEHAPPQPLFPPAAGLMPDFQFMSNDDILRAIQDMDMSKIASAIKTLGDAAAIAHAPAHAPGLVAPPPHAEAIPHSALPISAQSGVVLSTAPKSTKSSHKRILDMSLPGPEPSNPEHAHMLANKWMNASKLAELVKTQGLVYKKGKFSAIEEQQLKTAIDDFKAVSPFFLVSLSTRADISYPDPRFL